MMLPRTRSPGRRPSTRPKPITEFWAGRNVRGVRVSSWGFLDGWPNRGPERPFRQGFGVRRGVQTPVGADAYASASAGSSSTAPAGSESGSDASRVGSRSVPAMSSSAACLSVLGSFPDFIPK